jgi:hypothetical protein
MAGTVRWRRDLAKDNPFPGLYASTQTGGVVAASPLFFYFSQDTTSFRSGGADGNLINNPREILSRNETKNRFPYDHGNEFSTLKTDVSLSHKLFTIRSPYHNAWYCGPIVPANLRFSGYTGTNGVRFHLDRPSFDVTKGVEALRKTRPTKSAAELSRALAELMLSLPKIPFKALADHGPLNLRQLGSKGASEYLNVVFGWQPTVSDFLKIFKAAVNSGDIISQYILDSGRNVRRSLDWDPIVTNTTLPSLAATSASINYPRVYNGNDPHKDLTRDATGFGHSINLKATQVTERLQVSYRFSGAWTYWLDSDSTPIQAIRRYARLADRILGTGFDIELLWEIAPWSWLADWFVNIGDIISVNNALANDSLLLRYGYLTRKTVSTRTYSNPGYQFLTGNTGPVYATIRTTETVRKRATPYGFGLNTDAFTAQQWAILAALGMTGGDKKLRWG